MHCSFMFREGCLILKQAGAILTVAVLPQCLVFLKSSLSPEIAVAGFAIEAVNLLVMFAKVLIAIEKGVAITAVAVQFRLLVILKDC